MKDKVIIIPVHNQLPFLMKCVSSIISTTKDFKLIIVNDGSTDEETIKWINNNPLHCEVITHETPQGFSISCNDGIDYAMSHFDFDCLCLLNSDTEIVTENWFEKVESLYQSRKNVGVAGVVSDNAGYQTIKNIPKYLETINDKPTVNVNLVHGFCYFISKNLIMKMGRFDIDTFPHYGSEDDYAFKSIKNGFENILVGSVFVNHKGSASYSAETRQKLVSTTLPALKRRWTEAYVIKSIKISESALQKLIE